MDYTANLKISPREAVPKEGGDQRVRVEWLEKFGILPETATVPVTASLAEWAAAGCEIRADGTVQLSHTLQYSFIPMFLYARIRETGRVPDPCDATVVRSYVAKLRVEAEERETQLRVESEEREATERASCEHLRETGLEALLRGPIPLWKTTRDQDSYSRKGRSRAVLAKSVLGEDCYDRAEEIAATRNAELDRGAHDALAALRELATHEDPFARAATEGYPVERQMLDLLAERLMNRLTDECTPPVYGAVDTRAWKDPQDRAAPSPQTFRLLDAARVAVEDANRTIPAAIGRWTLSRIVRIDVCPHAAPLAHYVTCVLATLEIPEDVRQITWSLESLECDHEPESEDED